MSSTNAPVAMQFDDAEQQHAAAVFGMWIFLATEVLFFGGMIVSYVVYRYEYPDIYTAASHHLNLWAGGVMTAILLTGSLLVAMSDHLMEHVAKESSGVTKELQATIVRRLLITVALGVAFLALEFTEYYSLISEHLFPGANFDVAAFQSLYFDGQSAQIFFVLFFCMTGLHAIHMLVGVSLVGGLAIAMKRSSNPLLLRNPLFAIGLYWHFVDIVWIFLYPMFYLAK